MSIKPTHSKENEMNLETNLNAKLDSNKATESAEQFGVKIFHDAEAIAKETFDDAASQISTYSKKVMSFIKENPIVAVGAVAVAGLIIARLMTSKSGSSVASKRMKNLH
jgi:ElaB/YqjD/DUF883 family membrane-anchored ribosome-binding protein